MSTAIHQACLNHVAREAVARCPSCHHFFCRECITEHDDQVICANCLRKRTATAVTKIHTWKAKVAQIFLFCLAFFFTWVLAYTVALALLNLPLEVHDGSFWEQADFTP